MNKLTRTPASIRGRLLLATVVLLPLALSLTGWLLDRAFYRSQIAGQEEQLKLQVYALLAEMDYIDGVVMPAELLNPRLNQLNSGLYASVMELLPPGPQPNLLWQSGSAAARDLTTFANKLSDLDAGEGRMGQWAGHYFYAYPVIWELEDGMERALTVQVITSDETLRAALATYRTNVWISLGVLLLALVVTLLAVVHWGLNPLRKLAADLAVIERGDSDALAGDYPLEVQPVTDNLNRLLESERHRRERYRNTLSDLAHSLKTPLAVMRSAHDRPEVIDEQTGVMQQIVDYQLKRAVNQRSDLLRPIAVLPAVERVVAALNKVYADEISWQINVPAAAEFRGDEGDLMEVLGNVLDNACKYGGGKVEISATDSLRLRIGDNGPGVPEHQRGDILHRGARADTANHGHGIGLAVVIDIVAAYGGELVVGDSPLGGAEFTLTFPVQ